MKALSQWISDNSSLGQVDIKLASLKGRQILLWDNRKLVKDLFLRSPFSRLNTLSAKSALPLHSCWPLRLVALCFLYEIQAPLFSCSKLKTKLLELGMKVKKETKKTTSSFILLQEINKGNLCFTVSCFPLIPVFAILHPHPVQWTSSRLLGNLRTYVCWLAKLDVLILGINNSAKQQ